jgi:hypothetical protein
LLTLIFVVAFAYCLIENRSPLITVPVLGAAVFTGVSPRMKGKFGWQSGGGSSLGGEFGDPFEGGLTQAGSGGELDPGSDRGSAPKKQSAED